MFNCKWNPTRMWPSRKTTRMLQRVDLFFFLHKMDTTTVMQNFSLIHCIYCCEVMKNQKCLIFAKSSERFVNCWWRGGGGGGGNFIICRNLTTLSFEGLWTFFLVFFSDGNHFLKEWSLNLLEFHALPILWNSPDFSFKNLKLGKAVFWEKL